MNSGADWIARQLAARGVGPTAPPRAAPVVQSWGSPQGYRPQAVAPAQQYQQPPQQYQTGGYVTSDDLADPGSLAERAARSAHTPERTKICPECGGNSLFIIDKDENGRTLRNWSQRCMNCGWPSLQSGSMHGGASLSKAEGPVHQARQLRSDHAITVSVGTGKQTATFPLRSKS